MAARKDASADLQPGAAITFRDTLYTSRTLLMPDGRELLVREGQIAAHASEVLAYLDARNDFARLPE
jgi:hypothetical protein